MKTNQIALRSLLLLVPLLAAPAGALADFGDQIGKFTPGSGDLSGGFGHSIGAANDRILIGKFDDNDNGMSSGAAYLFDASSTTQLAKYVADDGAPDDYFGYSVALDGGFALVGAYGDDDNGLDSGSAYLFNLATGMQMAKLVPDDGAAGGYFGYSVALSNGLALVGAYNQTGASAGAAYVFNATTGTQLMKLTPDDGAIGDQFGFSVALSDGFALVGARLDDDDGVNSGSAYLFNALSGTQLTKLTADDGASNDAFGYSVALSDGLAIVGAINDADNGTNSGSAYIFNAASGAQLAKLTPSDGEEHDEFGASVAIADGLALVGSGDDDSGQFLGGTYLFDAATGVELAKLTPDDGEPVDYYGYSVALSSGVAFVGAYLDDDENYGAVYALSAVPEPGAGLLLAVGSAVAFGCRRRKMPRIC